MWGQAIDTAVGLTFLFAATALFCSALVEGFATVTERRSKYLITGLRNMLDAPEARDERAQPQLATQRIHEAVKHPSMTSAAARKLDATVRAQDSSGWEPGKEVQQCLTTALFNHPLIQSLQTRKVRLGADGRIRNPQYIPPATFARALVATLLPDGAPPDDPNLVRALRASVVRLPDELAAKKSLLAIIDQAEDKLETLQRALEDWYDAQMGRISGWYKRWAQAVLLVVGLAVAIVVNVDTVNVVHTLWVDEPVRSAVVAQATSGSLCSQETDPARRRDCAATEIGQLQTAGLPIGQPAGCQPGNWTRWDACLVTNFSPRNDAAALVLKLLGWVITAVAISYGAPFWFEAVSRIGSLRSTGPKP